MSVPSVSGAKLRFRRLLLAMLLLTTTLSASVAAAIDLSRFNAVQVTIQTDFELRYVNTHADGSQTWGETSDRFATTMAGEAFKRGHFEGRTYTAAWDEKITVSPGKIWKLNGSMTLTLSATDPPAVTAFRIEEFSDYPGSPTQPKFFPARTSSVLIAGPRADMVIPFYRSSSDPLNEYLSFRVTGPATCNAFAAFTYVLEYPEPTNEFIVRTVLIPPSTCASHGPAVYFEIYLDALPPLTPSCGEPGLRATVAMGAAAVPYCPEIFDIDIVQAIGLRQRVEHWKEGQPDKNFKLGDLNKTDQEILVTRSSDKPGKATWVRVYVTNPDPNPNGKPVGATLTLHGNRDGMDLGRLQEQTKDVPPGVKVDRESPKNSYTVFDFKLPPEWRKGAVEVTAEFVQPAQALPKTESLYVEPRKLRVGYVLFDDTTAQDKAIAKRAAWLMQLMYPAVVDYFEYSPVLQKVNPTTGARQLHLASLLNQKGSRSADVLVGWTKGGTAGKPGGGQSYRTLPTFKWLCDSGAHEDLPCDALDPSACPKSQPTDRPICARRYKQAVKAMVAPLPATAGWASAILPHEIGHLFLLEHPHAAYGGGLGLGTYHAYEPWGCDDCPGPKKVFDDRASPLHLVPPPYIETRLIQELKSRSRGQLPNGTGRTDFEFMWQSTGLSTKWAPDNRKPHNIWISQASWQWLFNKFPAGTSAAAELGQAAVAIPSLLLRGLVAEDGSAAAFDPALPVSSADPSRADGTYCLELQDGNGTSWARQCFEPSEIGDDGETGPSAFTEAVLLPPNLSRVRLYRGTTVLAEQRVSAHAPTVSIAAPAVGATLTGMTTLRWAGSDLDGDTLSYLVQYSPDNRQSWIALTVDETASMLDLDTSTLAGGNSAWVRVVATDGLNFATAEVGPLHVPAKGPQLVVTLPEPGTTFHEGTPVTLMATGYDPEDGGTPTEAFLWASDRDGPIDTDEIVTTRTLSVGHHVITVTASDSDGNVGNADVDLSIIPFCVGDCSVNGAVTVDELVKGVNSALGTALLDDCSAFDTNDDAKVSVDEFVRAVNAALNGCQ